MSEKMSPFQIAVFAIAIVIIVGSVIVFSMQRGSASQSKIPIDVWGTISADVFNEFQKRINELERDSLFVNYREISPDQFEAVLVEALASGSGPDAVIMSDDLLIKHENKLFLIDYKFYTQKTFKDNFIESGEILLRENGILGFPLTIDPLVFYWNRTILNNEGISSPPQFWDDLLGL
ncbi:MAG TPA: extracellular solute-binding protein, partial [Candidatus Paceibacterota bacterium]|nr:extracellular solute-binding protein [Candidatus Paceibacterota bacterium]